MEEVPCSDQIQQFKTEKDWSSLPGTCCQPDGSRIPRPIFHISSVRIFIHHILDMLGICKGIARMCFGVGISSEVDLPVPKYLGGHWNSRTNPKADIP